MRDLFTGLPPSPAEAGRLAIERARRDAEASAVHLKERELVNRARRLSVVVDVLGDRLAHLPDDAAECNATARLFHHSLAQLRNAEMALEVGQ
jgi:hypothetical protein